VRNYTTCMKFSNDFWKQQNDSVLQMVADGHGLSSTAPQLLSPPLASADARFSPNAPPHHQKPCGCLRAQPPRAAPQMVGRSRRGVMRAGASERAAHARSCTAAVRRAMARSARDACCAHTPACARACRTAIPSSPAVRARANHAPDQLPAAHRCCAAARLAGPTSPHAHGAAHRRRATPPRNSGSAAADAQDRARVLRGSVAKDSALVGNGQCGRHVGRSSG